MKQINIVIFINFLCYNRQIDGIAPTFSKKPCIKQEDEGKRLLFECTIQADPRPIISWIHDGKPVIDSPRHKVIVKFSLPNIIELMHRIVIIKWKNKTFC